MNLFIYLKTMQAVNKKMDPQKTLQTMQNFQKENMKMEMTEEMSKFNHCNEIFRFFIFQLESLFTNNLIFSPMKTQMRKEMIQLPSK